MYDVKFCISGMGGSYFTFSAMGFGVFVGHVGEGKASSDVGIGGGFFLERESIAIVSYGWI
jgi:hypothetical protein